MGTKMEIKVGKLYWVHFYTSALLVRVSKHARKVTWQEPDQRQTIGYVVDETLFDARHFKKQARSVKDKWPDEVLDPIVLYEFRNR